MASFSSIAVPAPAIFPSSTRPTGNRQDFRPRALPYGTAPRPKLDSWRTPEQLLAPLAGAARPGGWGFPFPRARGESAAVLATPAVETPWPANPAVIPAEERCLPCEPRFPVPTEIGRASCRERV